MQSEAIIICREGAVNLSPAERKIEKAAGFVVH